MMGAPVLPGALASLAPLLDTYGYIAVAVLILVEDFGVPAPGEAVLVAGAVYAGAGRLNIVVTVVIAIVAAVVGDNIGYAIGRAGGRRMVLRYGRYVFLTKKRLNTAERIFTRYGGAVVTARFVEGLRQANGIVAGITGMPWRRFLTFNALGAGLWVGTWASLGYLAGSHIAATYEQLDRYRLDAVAALAGIVAVLVAWHLVRRHRVSEHAE